MLKRLLLLGHRGARVPRIAENTIPAFDLALSHGCDGFEFDVRRSADGTAVICHNSSVGWKTVSRCSDDDLRVLPRLRTILARYASRAFLDIELKEPGLERTVISLLKQHPPRRGYVLSSFVPEILIELRRSNKSAPLGYICDSKRGLPLWKTLPCETAIIHQRLVTSKLIEEVHGCGKKIMAWTVNSPRNMKRLARLGVDGLISDDPELLCRSVGLKLQS